MNALFLSDKPWKQAERAIKVACNGLMSGPGLSLIYERFYYNY